MALSRSLVGVELPQPPRLGGGFGVRQTPIGYSSLADYWDKYQAREAAFRPPYPPYVSYKPETKEEDQIGLKGALAANQDVYGPRVRPDDSGGGWPDFPDPEPYVYDQFDAGASLRFGSEVDETHPYGSGQWIGGALGVGAGLLGGIPGLGLLGSFLGAYSDITDAEQAMQDLGYQRPDLSTWDAWDPLGRQAYGRQGVLQGAPDTSAYSQLMGHFMGITDPNALGYARSGMQELWSEDLDVPGLGSSEAAIRGAIAEADAEAQAAGFAEMAAEEAQEADEAGGWGGESEGMGWE